MMRMNSYSRFRRNFGITRNPKSLGSDGEPCGPATSGLLTRTPVSGRFAIYTGKESNSYEVVEQGTVHDLREVRTDYFDPRADPWILFVVPILKMINRPELARIASVTERQIARLRNGKQMPSPELREVLTRAAAKHARDNIGSGAPDDDLAAYAVFFQLHRKTLKKTS